MFGSFIRGNILHAEIVETGHNEFLSVTMAVRDSQGTECRVFFNEDNGLLDKFKKGIVYVGQEIFVLKYNLLINKSGRRTYVDAEGNTQRLQQPHFYISGVEVQLPLPTKSTTPLPVNKTVLRKKEKPATIQDVVAVN